MIFGLSVSSSWGNGHATLWRGLIRALAGSGHRVIFFERDAPYYAAHRDLIELPGGRLALYQQWSEAMPQARLELADADAAVVTSYCPDGVSATELVLESGAPLRVFYDLDTPVTLARLRSGETVPYIGAGGLVGFDLVLSYTGGAALDALRDVLGARRVAPLYGSVDPEVHRPVAPDPRFRADVSYLGTYAADRQGALARLFVKPARRLPHRRFLIGGAQYPDEFPWTANTWFVQHVPPGGARRVLLLQPAHAQCDPAADGGLGLVPIGPAVRGGGLRGPDPLGRLAGHSAPAPRRRLLNGSQNRARDHGRSTDLHRAHPTCPY